MQITEFVEEVATQGVESFLDFDAGHHGVLDANDELVVVAQHGGLRDETVHISIARIGSLII